MATELGQAYVQIMPSAKGISGAIKSQIDPEASSAGDSAGSKLGGNLIRTVSSLIAAAGIGKAFSASLMEGANLQQSLGGIETLFKGSANKVKGYADQAYKTSGLSANKYMENVTSFSASLLQSLGGNTSKAADKANMAMIDMSDNANKMGTNMEDIQNAYQGFAKQNYTMLDNLKLGYGGTKEEMQRLLKDATKLTGVKYDINNLSDVYSAIHAVQGQLGITGTTAKEAATTFSGSLDSMKAAASNVLGKMALGQDIGPSLNALAETASTFLFKNFLPMVVNILKALPGAISTFIKAAIPEVKGALGDLVKGGFGNFGDMIKNSMSGIAGGFGIAIASFAGFKALSPILSMISGGFGKLTSPLTSVLTKLPSIGKGFSNMGSAISGAATFVLKIGVGIGIAAAGLGLMALGFAKLAGTGDAGIAVIITTAIAVGGLAAVLAAIGPALTANAVGIGVFGAAVLAIGAGIGIASAGIALLVMSISNLGNNMSRIVPTMTALGVGFAGMITGFITTLNSNIPVIAASVTNMIVVMLQSFAMAMPQMVAAGMSMLVSFLQGISNNIFTITNTVILIVTNFINALAMNMPNIIASGALLLVNFLNGIAQALPGIITAAVNVLVAFLNGIASNLGRVISAGINLIFSFIDGIVNAIPQITNRAIQAVSEFVYGVGYAIGRVMTSGGQLINMFIKGISSGINGSKSAGDKNGNAVLKALTSIDLGAAGRAIIDGFIKGAQGMWNTTKNFFGGIGSWIKKHKGPISYDRKLLIPAGNAIMTGFNEGLVDKYRSVKNTVQTIAADIVDSAQISLPKIDDTDLMKSIDNVNGNINGRVGTIGSFDVESNFAQKIDDSMIRPKTIESGFAEVSNQNADRELISAVRDLASRPVLASIEGSSFSAEYEKYGSNETNKRINMRKRGRAIETRF